jgi:hypothetical protein
MRHYSFGQATVEYIFILAIAIMLGLQITGKFANFFRDQLGKVGHVLSTHLVVGVCKDNCFFGGYKNGYEGE